MLVHSKCDHMKTLMITDSAKAYEVELKYVRIEKGTNAWARCKGTCRKTFSGESCEAFRDAD